MDGSASDIDSAAGYAADIINSGLHPDASLTSWQPFGYSVNPPQWLVSERYRLVEKEMRWARVDR